ncbi:30S ribosome-binding factor RbfA [Paludisphaera sp.]|uniref:30S ribosome-binding factor RbfA n=1 Tax=Paludisphaera sp. TaxID=2017432 RepID=UPI00301E2820
MPSHRSLRIAEAIREVVATAVLFEVSDPRVRGVTVLRVEVAPDLRNATVFVTVMGSAGDRATAMKGLRSATGFLQTKVAGRLQLRYAPILAFKLDEGVKKSVEMGRLIEEAVASDRRTADEDDAEAPAVEGEEPDDDEDDEEGPDDADDDDPGDDLEDARPQPR